MAKPMPSAKGIPQETIKRVNSEWLEYWKEYLEEFPDADGSDYADEQQAFYREKFWEYTQDDEED
jgi:hypothetical protein